MIRHCHWPHGAHSTFSQSSSGNSLLHLPSPFSYRELRIQEAASLFLSVHHLTPGILTCVSFMCRSHAQMSWCADWVSFIEFWVFSLYLVQGEKLTPPCLIQSPISAFYFPKCHKLFLLGRLLFQFLMFMGDMGGLCSALKISGLSFAWISGLCD